MCFGFVNLYSDLDVGLSVTKSAVLNIATVFGTIIVIKFLPDKKEKIAPQLNHSFKFYLISLFILALSINNSGGFEEILKGSLHGKLISYVLLFFDATWALGLFLFFQKDIKYTLFAILLYILLLTWSGSRSAFIIIIITTFVLHIFENNDKIKNKLKPFLLICCLISPIIFFYGTSARGGVDRDKLLNLIIGRVSMVELSSVPIEAKDSGKMDVALYDNKYGIVNQFKQSINEISPLDPFEHDVNPNQYFRPIFFWESTEISIIDQYLSLNLTLPVYFYLNTNFIISCLISISFLSGLYYIWVKKSDNIYIFFGIIMSLYYLLQFFDWVMLVAGLFRMVLTIFTLFTFEKVVNLILLAFKDKKDIN